MGAARANTQTHCLKWAKLQSAWPDCIYLLWYSVLPGRIHRAVSPKKNFKTAVQQRLAARDQARWFSGYRSEGRAARAALQPPRQRHNLALIRRGWLEYPLTDRRQFDILRCGPARRGELHAIQSKPAGLHHAARRRGGRVTTLHACFADAR
jgi:hypothetical protein